MGRLAITATRALRLACASACVLAGLEASVSAQNFAPIAKIGAPDQAFVGDSVAFTSADSIDPDGGPQPLTFVWQFGDTAIANGASTSHVYSEAKAYPVTLTVSDGADTGTDVRIVHILARPLATRARHTTPIALSPAGDRLYVANPDSNSVSIVAVSAAGLTLLEERPVCRQPRTVSLDETAKNLFVACQGEQAIAVVDLASGDTTLIPVGSGPYGVLALASGGLLVTNQEAGTLTRIAADRAAQQTIAVGNDPRAIAVSADGKRAYVTSYVSRGSTGGVTVVELEQMSTLSLDLVNDPGPDTASSGQGIPNQLSAIAIDPAGRRVWVGGLKSNTTVGQFRSGGTIAAHNWLRGIAAPIDIATNTEVMQRRIDTNDADSVSAIAFSPDGRYAYLAHQGAGTLSIYDLSKATLFDPGAGTSVPFESRFDTGDAPYGIAVSADGSMIYVVTYLGREVLSVDVKTPTAPRILRRVMVSSEPLSPEVANGKRLFFRSRAPIHSEANYVACASCHADGGGNDGQVWDFTQGGEGLRNTTDLRGRAGMGQGLVHWSANFDEIQDFENPIVNLFGGTGLAQDGAPPNPPLGAPNAGRSQDLDDLAAYVTSLAYTPRSPERDRDSNLTEAAQRGKAIFEEPSLRCTECHAPPQFTISALDRPLLFDVGTLGPGAGARLGGPLLGIDVPTLIGLWNSAPYYHDGSAPTLRDVFRGRAGTLEAQLTAQLTEPQLADLIIYLRSLDALEPEPTQPDPPGDAGCGCRADRASSSHLFLLFAVLLVLTRRSNRRGGPTCRH